MPGAISDYLEAALLNEVFRNTNYVPPTTVYLATFTSATDDAAGGTESTGGSYARQPVAFGAPTVSGTTQQVANTAVVNFTNMPASTVTHVAYYDAVTGGNRLFQGPLTANKTLTAGDTLSFAVADLLASLD